MLNGSQLQSMDIKGIPVMKNPPLHHRHVALKQIGYHRPRPQGKAFAYPCRFQCSYARWQDNKPCGMYSSTYSQPEIGNKQRSQRIVAALPTIKYALDNGSPP
jgi:hypothetical protein